jgi:hypothetical protein
MTADKNNVNILNTFNPPSIRTRDLLTVCRKYSINFRMTFGKSGPLSLALAVLILAINDGQAQGESKKVSKNFQVAKFSVFKISHAIFDSLPTRGLCFDHNFLRFLPIFGEKIGVFFKKNNNVMIKFLQKIAVV